MSEQRGYPTSTHYRARYSSQHKPSTTKCVALFMISAFELEKIFVWRSVRSAAPDFNGGKRINCIMDLMSMPRSRARSDTMVILAGRAKRSSLGSILRKKELLTYKVGIALRSSQLELKTLAKSLTTSPSAIVCGVCAGGNKWWATRAASRTTTGQGHALLELISTGYGTVTGELHPPPRQGNARLTSSTAARLNIIDRPVYTFINIHHP